MPGNTFGRLFRITTWGESHGPALGAVIDGCPPGMPLTAEDIQRDLERRRPGKALSSRRREPDRVEILSGVFQGITTGTPISLISRTIATFAAAIMTSLRPFIVRVTRTALTNRNMGSGTGEAAVGAPLAKPSRGWRRVRWQESSWASMVFRSKPTRWPLGGVRCKQFDGEEIDRNALFCPDAESARAMEARLREVKEPGDSVGGIVEISARGCPAGLGEPVFDKLDARLAAALMSIGAVKGVEIGEGFNAAAMLGKRKQRSGNSRGLCRQPRRRHPWRPLNRHGDHRARGGETDPVHFQVSGDGYHRWPGRSAFRSRGAMMSPPSRALFRYVKRWCSWCWPTSCCIRIEKQFLVLRSWFFVLLVLRSWGVHCEPWRATAEGS